MAGNDQNVNMVALEIVLQRYPGTAGSDADRAIADVGYKITIGGKAAEGKTGADGKIRIAMPANAKATLEMLGTTYDVTPVATLEARNTVQGVQRRLQGLGYELGRVDGVVGVRTGTALLQFQADNAPLDTLGDATHAPTQAQLKTQFGE